MSVTRLGRIGFLLVLGLGLMLLPIASARADSSVVINQVFASGTTGNRIGSDYVELYNVGTTAVDLTGWSLQYATATAMTATTVVPLDGKTIAPAGYLLIKGSGSWASDLPTPDVVAGALRLNEAGGSLALCQTAVALPWPPQSSDPVVDAVGWGPANYCEGSPVGPPSAEFALLRWSDGYDTNNNVADFLMAIPVPHGSSLNHPPVAHSLSLTIGDSPLTSSLSGSDPDNDPLTFTIVDQPQHGSLGLSPASSFTCPFTYTPAADWSGSDSFTYLVNDGQVDSAPATVSITRDQPPSATSLTFTTTSSKTLSGTVSGSDPDNDPLTFQTSTPSQHGTFTFKSDGSFTYTPTFTYHPTVGDTAMDSFTYFAFDGKLRSEVATVTIVINPEPMPLITQVFAAGGAAPLPLGWYVELYNPSDSTIDLTGWSLQWGYYLGGGPPPDGTSVGQLSGSIAPHSYFLISEGPLGPGYPVSDLLFHYGPSHQLLRFSGGVVALVNTTELINPENPWGLYLDVVSWGLVGGGPGGTPAPAPSPGQALLRTPKAQDTDDCSTDFQAGSPAPHSSRGSTSINHAPVADSQNLTTAEDTALALTLTGSDADNDPLTYTVVEQPAHGTLSGAAPNLTYTPNPDYNGPDSCTYTANDGTVDSNVATVSITVTAVNDPPAFTLSRDSVSVDEDFAPAEKVSLTPGPVSSDESGQPVAYSISSAALGFADVSIDPSSGEVTISAKPDANGSGDITVRADDGQAAHNTYEQTIHLTVRAVNDPPALAPIDSETVDEGTLLTIAAAAIDIEITRGETPTQHLTYSLIDGTGSVPAGAGIDARTGVLTWTPSEAQGPGSYTFAVKVTDDGSPALSATTPVSVTVNEVNSAPTLHSIPDQTVDELSSLNVTAQATDPDNWPVPNTVTYSLTGAPSGMTIDSGSGLISWTPTEAQGPGDYSFSVVASDNGSPPLGDVKTVRVHVNEVNAAPSLSLPALPTSVNELAAWSFTATASDADNWPVPDALTYSLVGAPAGASIDPTSGVFKWTPTEAQGPGDFSFSVKVTDGGVPQRSDSKTVNVHVNELNSAPVLQAVPAQSGQWGDAIAFTATATDPDIPANTLKYSLAGGTGSVPTGATINATTGAFSWTPTASQMGTASFSVVVSDNGSPVLSGAKPVSVTVTKRSTALSYTGATNGQYSDGIDLSAKLTSGSAGGLSGKTITFKLLSGTTTVASATVASDASGVAKTTLTLSQAPGTYTVSAAWAGDASYVSSSDSKSFTISLEDATLAYSGDSLGVVKVNLNLQATVTDSAAVGYSGLNPENSAAKTIGDITKMAVAFDIYPVGSTTPTATVYAPVRDTGTAGDGIGTAAAVWTSATEGSYQVIARLVGATANAANTYYTAPNAEGAALSFYANSGQFAIGAGWVAEPSGGCGDFGLVARYDAKGKACGQFVYVWRGVYKGTAADFVIRSNSLTALSFAGSAYPLTATLTGTATLQVTKACGGTSLYSESGLAFTAKTVDSGKSSGVGSDTLSLTLTGSKASFLTGGMKSFSALALKGGNVVIHLK